MSTKSTHERYVQAVREAVIEWARETDHITAEEAAKLADVKLLYGMGDGTYRGVTAYGTWQNGGDDHTDIVEIAAIAEESWIQLAGTVVHELGHVLAGHGAGHSNDWKDTTKRLGFQVRPEAAGQRYSLALLSPSLRRRVYEIAQALDDGSPAFANVGMGLAGLLGVLGKMRAPRPCAAGRGTKGGKSQGKGSGSRLRLYECECAKPVKVRVASDEFKAHCDECGSAFSRKS